MSFSLFFVIFLKIFSKSLIFDLKTTIIHHFKVNWMRILKMVLRNLSDINLTSIWRHYWRHILSFLSIFVSFCHFLEISIRSLIFDLKTTTIHHFKVNWMRILKMVLRNLSDIDLSSILRHYWRHIMSFSSFFVLFLKTSIKSLIFELKTTTIHQFDIFFLKIFDISGEFMPE